eukprot:10001115-Alexandrium_andersonii.AAC.1
MPKGLRGVWISGLRIGARCMFCWRFRKFGARIDLCPRCRPDSAFPRAAARNAPLGSLGDQC